MLETNSTPIFMLKGIWALVSLLAVLALRVRFSKYLTKTSILLTRSNHLSIIIYTILFFPGVVVHELSHFFTAAALGVRTGDITLFPKQMEDGLKLGSVKVAKTDPLRMTLIGSAPFIVGTLTLYVLIGILLPGLFDVKQPDFNNLLSQSIELKHLGISYLIFAISNTMVLSKSDRRGFIPTAIIIIALTAVASLLPIPDYNQELLIHKLNQIIEILAITFSAVALLNLIALLPVMIIANLLEKISGRKIHFK